MAILAAGKVLASVKKKSGGIRDILYENNEPVSVEKIFEFGKKALFPDGK